MGLSTESRNEIIVSCVLFGLTSIVIAARFMSIRYIQFHILTSHILTAIAWVLLLGLVIEIVLWATIGGNGEHVWQMSASKMEVFYELFYANQVNYFALSPIIKLSICFFLRGIFSSAKAFDIASAILIVLLSCWGIAITLVGIFQCTPIERAWNTNVAGHCINQTAFLYGVQCCNIIFDFTLLVLPLSMIWNIHTSFRNKLQLCGVFSLGGVAFAAAIVRVVMLGQMKASDVPYTIYQATVWTLVEPCIALMCGSLPIIHGAVRVLANERKRKLDPYAYSQKYPTGTGDSRYRTPQRSCSAEFESYVAPADMLQGQPTQQQFQNTQSTGANQPHHVYIRRDFSVDSCDRST